MWSRSRARTSRSSRSSDARRRPGASTGAAGVARPGTLRLKAPRSPASTACTSRRGDHSRSSARGRRVTTARVRRRGDRCARAGARDGGAACAGPCGGAAALHRRLRDARARACAGRSCRAVPLVGVVGAIARRGLPRSSSVCRGRCRCWRSRVSRSGSTSTSARRRPAARAAVRGGRRRGLRLALASPPRARLPGLMAWPLALRRSHGRVAALERRQRAHWNDARALRVPFGVLALAVARLPWRAGWSRAGGEVRRPGARARDRGRGAVSDAATSRP